MKKRLIGLVLVLACLCVGVSVGSAYDWDGNDAYSCDNNRTRCVTREAAQNAGYSAGKALGLQKENGRDWSLDPVYKNKKILILHRGVCRDVHYVPEIYKDFSDDYISNYIIGFHDGYK